MRHYHQARCRKASWDVLWGPLSPDTASQAILNRQWAHSTAKVIFKGQQVGVLTPVRWVANLVTNRSMNLLGKSCLIQAFGKRQQGSFRPRALEKRNWIWLQIADEWMSWIRPDTRPITLLICSGSPKAPFLTDKRCLDYAFSWQVSLSRKCRLGSWGN